LRSGLDFLFVAAATTALGAVDTRCAGQTRPSSAAPAPYTVLRWDEDYAYLRDTPRQDDPFDPLKYVPLGGDAYLSLGGQVRYRYEFFDDNLFGAGPQDDDGYHLARVLLHVDLHLSPNLRVFVQGKSALEEGREGGPRANDADDIDLQQAFADVMVPAGEKSSLTLRVGRQELLYGAQRVIGPSDWTNVRRTFEGAKLMVALPSTAIDLFWVRPVLVDKVEFNQGDDDTSFAGAYSTTALPALIEGANSKLEVYALALNLNAAASPPGDSDTYTLGSRFTTKPRPWDLDVEGAWQFGHIANDSIAAYSLAIEGGYTFVDAKFSPRLFTGFDIASGSPDPAHRYNQLFPTGHAVFGYIDAIGRQNIIDVHPGVIVSLTKKLTLRAEHHWFWRENSDDAAYTAAGAVLRPDNGSDASFIGSEFDLLLNWQIDRHLNAYFGYSHFFPGEFIDETGPSEDIDFLYAALQFTF
jgi:hypothetical protein